MPKLMNAAKAWLPFERGRERRRGGRRSCRWRPLLLLALLLLLVVGRRGPRSRRSVRGRGVAGGGDRGGDDLIALLKAKPKPLVVALNP